MNKIKGDELADLRLVPKYSFYHWSNPNETKIRAIIDILCKLITLLEGRIHALNSTLSLQHLSCKYAAQGASQSKIKAVKTKRFKVKHTQHIEFFKHKT